MLSFLKLIRYPNLLMVSATMLLTKYILVDSSINTDFITIQFCLLILSVVFITTSGYIINDIFDIEADKINKPSKTFIGNSISKKNAWLSYFIINFIGLSLGVYVSFSINKPINSLFFIGTTIGLFIYSKYLKKTPLLGNICIAFFTTLTIIISYVFHNNNVSTSITNIIKCYVLFSFLTTLIREILKDIEDIQGDYKLNMKTLPIIIGIRRTNRVTVAFSLLLILILIIITKEFLLYSPTLLAYCAIFIIVPLFIFTYKLYNAKTKKDYSFLSAFIKFIMLSGILSMFLI